MVLVLTACPSGLRGHLTRWLLEISTGVFVGTPSKRVRELLWEETKASLRQGRAILVYRADNEQRLAFDVHGHHWEPVDLEGITLMLRPASERDRPDDPRRIGASKASKYRRYGS